MLTDRERLRALVGNIKNWSWEIYPVFKIDEADARALIEYFKEHDRQISGALAEVRYGE